MNVVMGKAEARRGRVITTLYLKKNYYYYFAALDLCCCWVSSSCSEQGLLSSCNAWASHYSSFSCLQSKHGLSSPGAWV